MHAAPKIMEPERLKPSKSLDYRKFDGQIISVIDSAMIEGAGEPLVNDNTYFFDPASGKYATSNYWFRACVLQAIMNFEQHMFGRIRHPEYKERLGFELEHAHETLQKEFLPIIMEGRLKMSLLIDSPGGDIEMCYLFQAMVHDVQKRGGHVDAYVDTKAHSAGARLFLQSNRRFAHSGSAMLIHDAYDEITGEDVKDRTYGSRVHTLELLEKACNPRKIWQLRTYDFERRLENLERIQSGDPYAITGRPTDVEFSASELKGFGIARVLPDLDALMQMFFLETGTNPEEIRDQMRLIHSLGRPGFKEKPEHIEPVAQFYINALEREGSV